VAFLCMQLLAQVGIWHLANFFGSNLFLAVLCILAAANIYFSLHDL
jgi:hypothetical protein